MTDALATAAASIHADPPALLLDLGNTRLKVSLWHAGQMHFLGAHPHQDQMALLHWFQTLLTSLAPPRPTRAYGVSVATEETMLALASAIQRHCDGLMLQWIWPTEHAFGLTNAYPNPRQLGADRWAGMLGLMHHFQAANHSIVLANFGTATTIDTLSRDKHFLGGLILPGVSMMQLALSKGTARLPVAQGQIADHPTNTHAAITTGIMAAQLGAVRRQLELSQQRDEGQPPVLCVSGGAWEQVQAGAPALLPHTQIVELPHVVLDGLCRVATHSPPQSHPQDEV